MAIAEEDRHPIIEIMRQTPDIPDNCQWAIFLRNHDELTLEMVTERERDYMYRMYAADPRTRINLGIRRRLAPLLENNRRQDPADEQPAAHDAGLADHLLRRRDRAWATTSISVTATACARRCSGARTATPASRGRSAAALPAADHGLRVRLPGASTSKPSSAQPVVAAELDAAPWSPCAGAPCVLARHARASCAPATAKCSPTCASTVAEHARASPTCRAIGAAGRARPGALQGPRAGRAARRTPFPPIGELPYLLTPAGVGLLLVLACRRADQAPSWHRQSAAEMMRLPRLVMTDALEDFCSADGAADRCAALAQAARSASDRTAAAVHQRSTLVRRSDCRCW